MQRVRRDEDEVVSGYHAIGLRLFLSRPLVGVLVAMHKCRNTPVEMEQSPAIRRLRPPVQRAGPGRAPPIRGITTAEGVLPTVSTPRLVIPGLTTAVRLGTFSGFAGRAAVVGHN